MNKLYVDIKDTKNDIKVESFQNNKFSNTPYLCPH